VLRKRTFLVAQFHVNVERNEDKQRRSRDSTCFLCYQQTYCDEAIFSVLNFSFNDSMYVENEEKRKKEKEQGKYRSKKQTKKKRPDGY
jgi:hypothetical protein